MPSQGHSKRVRKPLDIAPWLASASPFTALLRGGEAAPAAEVIQVFLTAPFFERIIASEEWSQPV